MVEGEKQKCTISVIFDISGAERERFVLCRIIFLAVSLGSHVAQDGKR
jgi:hypothetical protein